MRDVNRFYIFDSLVDFLLELSPIDRSFKCLLWNENKHDMKKITHMKHLQDIKTMLWKEAKFIKKCYTIVAQSSLMQAAPCISEKGRPKS